MVIDSGVVSQLVPLLSHREVKVRRRILFVDLKLSSLPESGCLWVI
jgi:hypothetical protein